MPTQPHCPTCRDTLVAAHAVQLADLTDQVAALGELVLQLAVHLGAIDEPECPDDEC